MTNDEVISLFKEAIDNISKALGEFYNDLPEYLRTEMLHPKKKPRGSIRRKRKGSDSE